MKNELVASFVEGFKDSFRLAACLFVSIVAVIGAFSNHALSDKMADMKRNGQTSSPN